MGMGDIGASVFLELGKGKIADVGQEIDPQAAEQLEKCGYVDDVAGGGSEEDVKRMRGDLVVEQDGKLTFTGTVSQILDLASFRPKAIICSGETDERILSKLGKYQAQDLCIYSEESFGKIPRVVRTP